MTPGKVYKLCENIPSVAGKHGYLWVYEGAGEDYNYMFRAIATGFLGGTNSPRIIFENWEAEDEDDAG
jgi:hypothetical protein